MKQVFQLVKWCLSFLFDIPVEKVSSKTSTELKVYLHEGRYILATTNAIYSNAEYYSSYRTAFEQLKPETRKIKNSLMLGIGLGSIPLILSKKHQVHCSFTAVDIDPAVIELSKKYSIFPEKSDIKLVCADAYEFVLNSTETYDLVNADLYIDDMTPPQFEKLEFLEGLKKCIAPGGLLLYSRFYYEANHRALTDRFIKNAFSKVFPGYYTIPSSGNLMLVYEKDHST